MNGVKAYVIAVRIVNNAALHGGVLYGKYLFNFSFYFILIYNFFIISFLGILFTDARVYFKFCYAK